jgi:hypothetical protein
MNEKKQGRFSKWIDKLLYNWIVASHSEDYISEDKDGNPVRTTSGIWQSGAFNQKSNLQR